MEFCAIHFVQPSVLLNLINQLINQSLSKTVWPGTEALRSTEDVEEEEADTAAWESCSEDSNDDDSDGEWIDVHHSSDEEGVMSLLCRSKLEECYN